jgi:hypothetical protein
MQPRFDQNVFQVPPGPAEFLITLQPDETGSDLGTTCRQLLPVLPLTLAEMELLLQESVVDLGAIKPGASEAAVSELKTSARQFEVIPIEGVSSAGGLGVAAMILKHLEPPGNDTKEIDNKEVTASAAGAPPSASTNDY